MSDFVLSNVSVSGLRKAPPSVNADCRYAGMLPTADDFNGASPYDCPSLHYSFCYDHKLLCVRKVRRKYVLSCRGYVPHGVSLSSRFVDWTNLGEYGDFWAAVCAFRARVVQLLDDTSALEEDSFVL